MINVFENPRDLRTALSHERSSGHPVAFVPTMGYLHDGHAALIRHAGSIASRVVVSLFVNPLQFGPGEDFSRYPRDLARDQRVMEDAGASDLFLPTVETLTPGGLEVQVEPGSLAGNLCGKSRPGHFRGVCTIVAKLLNIVQPTVAVFGWKDAQQLIIIRKMVKDLDFPVRVEGVETVRESDGLAMSSRNSYLSPVERLRAPWLYRALDKARSSALKRAAPSVRLLLEGIRATVHGHMGARIDYVDAVSQEDLSPLQSIQPGNTMIAAAVFLGNTRLIDNVRF